MAGTPDVAVVRAVLNRAVEVGANRVERAKLAGGRTEKDPRAVPELEDLPRVGCELAYFGRHDGLVHRFGDAGRHHEFQDRVEEGHGRSQESPT